MVVRINCNNEPLSKHYVGRRERFQLAVCALQLKASCSGWRLGTGLSDPSKPGGGLVLPPMVVKSLLLRPAGVTFSAPPAVIVLLGSVPWVGVTGLPLVDSFFKPLST